MTPDHPQGPPPQGYPPQGHPQQGYPPQGYYPPQGPPPGYYPPPAQPALTKYRIPLIAGGVALLALLAFLILPGDAEAGEVFLVPAASAGPDPFSATPFAPPPNPALAQPAAAAGAPLPAPANVPIAATSAAQPGLYGGTQNMASCDTQQMVAFLGANPDKASAWVAALTADPDVRLPDGQLLTTATIPAYAASLTPITLMKDTRVTNHGFKNGRQTRLQSVLQKGSAVLVDSWGVPRVKCYCGNPLLPPIATPRTPVYAGPRWPDFDPARLDVVQRSSTPIQTFVLTDPATGAQFSVVSGAASGGLASAPGPTSGSQLLTHDSGRFQITVPNRGWIVKTDGSSTVISGAPYINYTEGPETGANKLSIVDLTDFPGPADQYTAAFAVDQFHGPCVTGPPEPFSTGRFAGSLRRFGPCPSAVDARGTYEAIPYQTVFGDAIAPDGARVGFNYTLRNGQDTAGVEQMLRDALNGFRRR